MKNLIAIMLLGLLGSAYAQSPSQEPKGSRINLDARATEEVDNDVMRAALFVEEDFRRMTDAIGKLQAVMQLGAASFSVSPAKRAKVEDGLTQSAIAEFLRKAESATKGFKGARYSVLEATISADGGNIPPPRPMVMMKSTSSDAPAPDFEAGSSRITVTVNGAILIPR